MIDLSLPDHVLAVLRSPMNGKQLRWHGPGVLSDGEGLWPCVDGIAYLRRDREGLRAEVVDALQAERPFDALGMLLGDRRDATIPPVLPDQARRVAGGVPSARAAMEGLGYGDLAWYMENRWCEPSYLSGLALLEAHAPRGCTLLEVACGTGQFLRAWLRANPGAAAIGADVVYSHLWIARHFVAPTATLVCVNVEGPFPLTDEVAGVALAHDSFHYFVDKLHVHAEMRRVTLGGLLLFGHVHNSAQPNLSAGVPLDIEAYEAIIEPRAAYVDDDLTRAALGEVDAATPASTLELRAAPALAFATHDRPAETAQLTLPPPGAPLRTNPLLVDGHPIWPSSKFEAEFVGPWTYLRELASPDTDVIVQAQAGGVGSDPGVDWLARQRVLLDLPERWL